jgi:hypothetical protein
MRATIAPAGWLELGISRTVMFDGENDPELPLEDWWRVIFEPEAGDRPNREKFRNNSLFAIDAEVRLSNVDRYMIPAKDLRLYLEFGWDDTCCETAFVPLQDAVSFLFGVHAINIFGQRGIDARFEYARSSFFSFTHDQFSDGYFTRGHVISHVMGREATDIMSRVTNRLREDLMLGLELVRSEVGNTRQGFRRPKERSLGGAIDLSYRFAENYALFAQYRVRQVENRNFDPGADGFDHFLRFELTRYFR